MSDRKGPGPRVTGSECGFEMQNARCDGIGRVVIGLELLISWFRGSGSFR